jgi:hypothetical protein
LYTLYPTVLPTASPLSADIRSATASDTEQLTLSQWINTKFEKQWPMT